MDSKNACRSLIHHSKSSRCFRTVFINDSKYHTYDIWRILCLQSCQREGRREGATKKGKGGGTFRLCRRRKTHLQMKYIAAHASVIRRIKAGFRILVAGILWEVKIRVQRPQNDFCAEFVGDFEGDVSAGRWCIRYAGVAIA